MDRNPRSSRQPSLAPSASNDMIRSRDADPAEKKRERKRETDRAAQREHRKRQKIYVEELEARLDAMKSNNESEQVAALLEENERLRREVNYYKKSFASIEVIVKDKQRQYPNAADTSPKEDSNESELDDTRSSLSYSAQHRSMSVASAHSRIGRRQPPTEYHPMPYVEVYSQDQPSNLIAGIGGIGVSSPGQLYTSPPEQMSLPTPGLEFQGWNMPVFGGSMDSGMAQMTPRHNQSMQATTQSAAYSLGLHRDNRSGSQSRQDTPDLHHYPHSRRT